MPRGRTPAIRSSRQRDILLVFDAVAASLLWLFSGWGDALGRFTGKVTRHPGLFFVALVAITTAAYVPMTFRFGPFSWAFWGPFGFQTSRILFYLVYFFAGIGLGAWGLDRGLLASDGKLARQARRETLGSAYPNSLLS